MCLAAKVDAVIELAAVVLVSVVSSAESENMPIPGFRPYAAFQNFMEQAQIKGTFLPGKHHNEFSQRTVCCPLFKRIKRRRHTARERVLFCNTQTPDAVGVVYWIC